MKQVEGLLGSLAFQTLNLMIILKTKTKHWQVEGLSLSILNVDVHQNQGRFHDQCLGIRLLASCIARNEGVSMRPMFARRKEVWYDICFKQTYPQMDTVLDCCCRNCIV
jgi:hypothetical protein